MRHHVRVSAVTPEATTPEIDTLLFAQHGWADTNQAMLRFGQEIAGPGDLVIAPNLGYVRTWLRIEPLIATVERGRLRSDEHSIRTPTSEPSATRWAA